VGGSPGPDYTKDDATLSFQGVKCIISETAVFVKVAGKELRISRTDAGVSFVTEDNDTK